MIVHLSMLPGRDEDLPACTSRRGALTAWAAPFFLKLVKIKMISSLISIIGAVAEEPDLVDVVWGWADGRGCLRATLPREPPRSQ
jgi:hypothetical protein